MEKKGLFKNAIYLGLALSLLVSIAIIGCGETKPVTTPTTTAPAKATTPKLGGILKITPVASASMGSPTIGYPAQLVRSADQRLVAPSVETLFRVDESGKLVPWLATEYKEDAKAKTITLLLRKGVKFHDGTDFNAAAVKWNLDECKTAKTAGTEQFVSIDVVDDYAVRINLKEWDSTVVGNLSLNVGMMISPTAFKTNGKEWAVSNPVGTGPFTFVSWKKDVNMIFKKNANYWQQGKPYLDEINFVFASEAMVQELSFKSGEVDVMQTTTPQLIKDWEKEGKIVSRGKPGSGAYGIIPDSANPKSPFADVRVRQATAYAIDNQAIVNAIFFGEAEAANQFVRKSNWGYNPSVIGYPYNPAKAKQLLAEAGYTNGLKTKFMYRTGVTSAESAVQGYLKAVGIDAEADIITQAKYDQIAFNGGTWEGFIWGGISPSVDVSVFLNLRFSGRTGFYTQMLVPEDYLKSIQNSIAAPDFASKQKYVQESMKLMIDKYCLQCVVYCPNEYAISQNYVHNHGWMGVPNTTLWTPEEAWIDKK